MPEPVDCLQEPGTRYLIISFPAACPPRSTPPAQLAELLDTTISRGLRLEREPACQLPVAASVVATDQGRDMAWPCRLPQVVDAYGWHATKVTAMAFCSRTTHQRWLAGPSPHGPGMMAAAGAGAGRDRRRLDPRRPSCVVGLSLDGRRRSLTGCPSLHCYPRCGGVSLIHTQAGMMLQSYPP